MAEPVPRLAARLHQELVRTLLRCATARGTMPERKTVERARKLKREGKAPSTQAGEFVRGRDRAHPRRQARGPIGEAGDRHRPVQGQTGGREVVAAEEGSGVDTHARGREARLRGRPVAYRQGGVVAPVARGDTRARTRAAQRRIAPGAFEAGAERRTAKPRRTAPTVLSETRDRSPASRPSRRR